VIAIQDMGAAGLTCSAVEMGAKGGLGIELEPRPRAGARGAHDAYEMMLSESQERMLMVLRPEKEAEPRRSSTNGASTSPSSARPPTTCASASSMGDEKSPTCRSRNWATKRPEYDRPWVPPVAAAPLDDVAAEQDYDRWRRC
jgi:hypothetical protein